MEKAIINMGEKFLQNTEHIHADWVMEKEYPLQRKCWQCRECLIVLEQKAK